MKDFFDKVAVITGGASGIGFGLAQKCAQEKMKIVLADVDEDKLDQAKTLIESQFGANVITITADISKQDQIEEIAEVSLEHYGRINLLINNAGVCGPLGAIWEIPSEQLQWTLDVNLIGTIYALRIIVPIMLAQKDQCHIVNVSSHAGLVSNPGLTAYQITKHAIVTLSETLQHDLMLRASNIQTSVFFPFFVQSNLPNSGRHLKHKELYVANQARELLDKLTELTDQGISPTVAAEILFDGIRADQFYIFTDDRSKTSLEERVSNILNDHQPVLPK
jgi:short-subunit dehydrogenase